MLWRTRKRAPPAVPRGAYLLIIVVTLAAKAWVLHAMGRPLICPCGVLRLWRGDPRAADASQQLADWYSASHVIFGILLFWLMWKTSRHWPKGWLLVVAVGSSVVWEIAENTPALIARFGQGELGQYYRGDSILNSMGDTIFVVIGFGLARALPVPATVAVVLGLEAAAALTIRDSFLLTAVTFLYPFAAITAWQRGA